MGAGIVSYGAYVPIYRLSRAALKVVWGGGAGKGEKAVANADEDTITMAVAAAMDCLKGTDAKTVDGLYFASTTAPYREKRAASIVAAALDLPQGAFTADFTNSLGSGAGALRAAIDAVNGGSAKKVLVVASDCRIPPPNSLFESLFGDGAAAFLVGGENLIATVEGHCTLSSGFLDIWRKERGDRYVRTWENRFIIDKGYFEYLKDALDGLLKSCGLTAGDIGKAAYYGPDERSHATMAGMMGLKPAQVQPALFDTVGNTGAAFFMMLTVAALEKSRDGDRILSASYGDGADAFLLRVTDRLAAATDRRGIARHVDSKMMLASYGKYLRFRDLMDWEQTPTPAQESSENVFYREEKALFRGYGHKCGSCGHVQFPPQRICMWCQTKDRFEAVRVVDKRGRLFTFSLDERAVFALDLPNVLVIVDLEGGGRIYNQATDRDPGKLEVGMEMEFTFRKFHEGSGFHNYSWKIQPVRC
ncbi:MAG: OB-fold domain-containing protein [Desulfobacterales bacterium]|nr:OB-fold domain-containing protein [Desulfobacterales bacterium]